MSTIKEYSMDIFVGSLPFKLKESQLRELFEKFGEVSSATIIIDKSTRQNRGYGFVEMPNAKEAMSAIKALNNTEVMERKIIVSRSDGKKYTDKKGKSSAKGKSSPKEKGNGTWASKLYAKKKKVNVISRHGDEEKDAQKKKKRGGVKLAKNFKVGARKKR